jgi:hypothetical protein
MVAYIKICSDLVVSWQIQERLWNPGEGEISYTTTSPGSYDPDFPGHSWFFISSPKFVFMITYISISSSG